VNRVNRSVIFGHYSRAGDVFAGKLQRHIEQAIGAQLANRLPGQSHTTALTTRFLIDRHQSGLVRFGYDKGVMISASRQCMHPSGYYRQMAGEIPV
jgi:hypothetical protein